MVRIFIGYDSRQPIAYHVLCSSILRRSSVPVSITPLMLKTLPIERTGLTEFTFARYLVPWLCNYEGQAVFMDSDMLVLGDVAELTTDKAVSVVNFDKEFAYERTSVMVFDNAACTNLTPEYIEHEQPQSLAWAPEIGELDRSWNFLVGYDSYEGGVNLAHFTQGIPEYKECRNCDFAREWFTEKNHMLHSVSWLEMMGKSVHAEPVLNRLAH